MAIYRLEAKTGSKAQGKSGRAKVDYLARAGKYSAGNEDECRLIHSANMPDWATAGPTGRRAGSYWKAADEFERSNGQLFRELIVAIPVELNIDQQNQLALAFAVQIGSKGEYGLMPYTIAIHEGKGHNPHFHLVLSERINDGLERSAETWFKRAAIKGKDPASGGARKASIGRSQVGKKKWLKDARLKWQDMANAALAKAGFDDRIDHRSLRDQGLDQKPQPKIGPKIMVMEAKGIRTDKAQAILNDFEREELKQEKRRNEDGNSYSEIREFSEDAGEFAGSNDNPAAGNRSPSDGFDRGIDNTDQQRNGGLMRSDEDNSRLSGSGDAEIGRPGFENSLSDVENGETGGERTELMAGGSERKPGRNAGDHEGFDLHDSAQGLENSLNHKDMALKAAEWVQRERAKFAASEVRKEAVAVALEKWTKLRDQIERAHKMHHGQVNHSKVDYATCSQLLRNNEVESDELRAAMSKAGHVDDYCERMVSDAIQERTNEDIARHNAEQEHLAQAGDEAGANQLDDQQFMPRPR